MRVTVVGVSEKLDDGRKRLYIRYERTDYSTYTVRIDLGQYKMMSLMKNIYLHAAFHYCDGKLSGDQHES